jgi:hypothetical protein
MSALTAAIRLIGMAAELSPLVERFVRAAVDADPRDPIAQRVASVLPARSESEKAAEELRKP